MFLGLTVGCCRCHSHKYDPLPHTDYYKLFAFYNDADEIAEQLPIGAKDLTALEAKLRPLEAALLPGITRSPRLRKRGRMPSTRSSRRRRTRSWSSKPCRCKASAWSTSRRAMPYRSPRMW